MNYTPIIGLEIHVELNTKTKMFCRCSPDIFGAQPNTHTCPVCLGLPGALPYTNKEAIESCIKIAQALNCSIHGDSLFERKNYFYPDLTKGFQTSQYLNPFGYKGFLEIKIQDPKDKNKTTTKRIGITRVHMEEDTGKNTHTTVNGKKVSLLDFNRSGVPLVEIVTEPDIHSGEEAKTFLTELQKIIRYLGVSDADMEKGNMRLEPNISLREITNNKSQTTNGKLPLPPYKVEVKNINSFRFVDKAVQFEIKRQTEILDSGELPKQETRGWNENKNQTISQRSKEEAHDYRYFPEPDIPPIQFDESQITNLKSQIAELPIQKTERYEKEYGLPYYDAEIITREKSLADYFETAVEMNQESGIKNHEEINPKIIANWIINKKVNTQEIEPAKLIALIKQSTQKVQTDPAKLKEAVEKVLSENEKVVADYKNGKIQVIGFLIGQTKRLLPEADAQEIKKTLEDSMS